MHETEKQQWTDFYCLNEMRELKKLSRPILQRMSGVYQRDYDDFYSLAQLTLLQVLDDYNGTIPFDVFFRMCLLKKFHTYLTWKNRDKRKQKRKAVDCATGDECVVYVEDLSLEMPVSEEEQGECLADVIASDYSVEQEVEEKIDAFSEKKVERYLERLSKKQRAIVGLLSEGYRGAEIRDVLRLTPRAYYDCMRAIQSYENVKLLY